MFAIRSLLTFTSLCCLSTASYALPMLQLGPGSVGSWSYNTNTDTWVTGTNPFSLKAYANSDGVAADGAFAWDTAGATDRYTYLVVSAVPMAAGDSFDVTVENDGGALPIFDSGSGAPPVQDNNSLAPHDIFDTYFEIYQFQFDGATTTIFDTEPGKIGSGEGYEEEFDITINGLVDPVYGIHIDLFTVEGDGTYDPSASANSNKDLVKANAPFSHDAQYIPEPAAGLLLLTGLLAACLIRTKFYSR